MCYCLFSDHNTVHWLKFKLKITGQTGNNDTKHLSNFWRTLEIPLLIVTSSNAAADQETTFVITDTKLYVPVATLST